METIAEYGIKLKVNSADFKQQIGDLRKEARVLGQIGKEFSHAAHFLTAAVVAPITALSAMGVKKYLETTDAGAKNLKSSLGSLLESWNQMLARIGKAVVGHGELGKKIESLKHWLDSIDEKKILQMINLAKWTAMLATVLKITGEFYKWKSLLLKMEVNEGILAMLEAKRIGKGGVISSGQAVLGIAGVAGTGGILKLFKEFREGLELGSISFNKFWQIIPKMTSAINRSTAMITANSKYFSKGRSANGEFMSKANSAGLEALTQEFAKGAEAIVKIVGVFKTIGALLAKIAKIFFVFDMMAGFFRGLGFKLKDGLDLLWKSIMFFADTIDWIVSLLASGFENFGIILKGIFTGKSMEEMISKIQDVQGKVVAKRPWNKGDENGKFDWNAKGKVSSVGFADLNKSVQNWETQKEGIKAQKDNTEALKVLHGDLKGKGKGEVAGIFGGGAYNPGVSYAC